VTDPSSDEYAASRPAVRAAAELLSQIALVRIQEKPSGRARVEDYLTVLGAMTGEAAVVAAGVFDIESTDLTPGSPVFGPQINAILTGDDVEIDVPPNSVIGILTRELDDPPATPAEIERLYRLVASNAGETAWGQVATSVPENHRPGVLPIQVAFDLRDAVTAAQTDCGLPGPLRHVPCALALALGLRRVANAMDTRLAVTLALEVTFGMAKMVPMPKSVFAQFAALHKPN
jgi:hypothetical protein